MEPGLPSLLVPLSSHRSSLTFTDRHHRPLALPSDAPEALPSAANQSAALAETHHAAPHTEVLRAPEAAAAGRGWRRGGGESSRHGGAGSGGGTAAWPHAQSGPWGSAGTAQSSLSCAGLFRHYAEPGSRRCGPATRRLQMGAAERGRNVFREHPTDAVPGAQVLLVPPLLPGRARARLRQGEAAARTSRSHWAGAGSAGVPRSPQHHPRAVRPLLQPPPLPRSSGAPRHPSAATARSRERNVPRNRDLSDAPPPGCMWFFIVFTSALRKDPSSRALLDV